MPGSVGIEGENKLSRSYNMQQLGEEEEEQGGSGILDDSAETIYDDMRFVVERHKREQDFKKRQNRLKAIKREQLL